MYIFRSRWTAILFRVSAVGIHRLCVFLYFSPEVSIRYIIIRFYILRCSYTPLIYSFSPQVSIHHIIRSCNFCCRYKPFIYFSSPEDVSIHHLLSVPISSDAGTRRLCFYFSKSIHTSFYYPFLYLPSQVYAVSPFFLQKYLSIRLIIHSYNFCCRFTSLIFCFSPEVSIHHFIIHFYNIMMYNIITTTIVFFIAVVFRRILKTCTNINKGRGTNVYI